ncbi:hypothetical protein QQ020_03420 [Fulvivirgaceae bacterium BMA12]|uniref:Outer membrane protein beta-barrel domain-containing protein n=1 Tax=Agaribacillus aureus TaxID=3051825 RepID=A0ABT8L014_9BACT|nr:hypothetical protein [Fulvivirgaceae bacterium BMA12]
MFRLAFCLFFLSAIFNDVFSQEKKEQLAITVTTGFKTGWWIYHRGSSNGSSRNDLGWDRSHYQPKLSLGTGFSYRYSKITTTIFLQAAIFIEDNMLEHEDFKRSRKKYIISDGVVSFLEYGMEVGYDLIAGRNFSLSPTVGAGFFEIGSKHPEKENFGSRHFWHVGIQNQVRKGKFTWVLTPEYQEMTILPKEERNNREKHKIHSLGLNLGLRYWIK